MDESVNFEKLSEGAPFRVSLAAGALAGIAEHTVIFPLDVIKTRLQVLSPHPSARYTSSADAFTRILSTEGFRQLWRGVFSMVAGAGPAHAAYFATYEQAKIFLGISGHASDSPLRTSVCGAAATTVSDALMNPFDVVKQRMQMHGSPYKSILDCFLRVLREERWIAFYRSYPTTVLLNVPFHSVQFPVYETLRERLYGLLENSDEASNNWIHIVAGGTAGGTAAFLTTPIDVVKTALQTGHTGGMLSAARQVHTLYGPMGFFRGALPRTLTFVPSTGICWACYEYFKRQFL